MPAKQTPKVLESLAILENDAERLLKLAEAMVNAYGGTTFPFDLLANGAVNRSLALSAGFRTMISNRNLTCAAPLIRLQLDTALRFYAGFLVDNPHDFALKILEGEHVRRLRDRDGALMTDAYLRSKLSADFSRIDELYEKTSGYVHLSEVHIRSTFEKFDEESRSISFKMGEVDIDLSEEFYLEAIGAFQYSTLIFARYLNGWVVTKENTRELSTKNENRDTTHK